MIGMTVYGSAFTTSTNILAINTSTKTITISPGAITLAAPIPAGTTIAATAGDGDNIRFGGKEAVIADNIIQNAGGWGINLPTARSVRANTNFLDGNGRQIPGTGALLINGSAHITVCSNTISQSALASVLSPSAAINSMGLPAPAYYAAHILFKNANDSVAFCGNTYLPIHSSGSNSASATPASTTLDPDYTYDVDPAATLTNISIADNLAPQLLGTLSPNAARLLGGSLTGVPTPGYITGLTLSNVDGSTSQVSIAPGTATDSTGSTTITLASPCVVDLAAANGPGGIDTTSIATNTTYYFYVVSSASGGSPSCMASTRLKPQFQFAPTRYQINIFGMLTSGSPVVFNLGQPASSGVNNLVANPLGGVLPGDQITATNGTTSVLATTTVQSGAPYRAFGIVASYNSSPNSINISGSVSGVLPGMLVAGNGIPPNTTVGASPPNCTSGCSNFPLVVPVVMPPVNLPTSGSTALSFSGNFTLTANANPSASATPPMAPNVTIYAGRYRLVGALYTTSPTALVSFKQDGDTFYLTPPVLDLQPANCALPGNSTAATRCALSVPCGRLRNTCGASQPACLLAGSNAIAVQAFGRVLGGPSSTMVSSPDQALSYAAAAADLTSLPGFVANGLAAKTVYPFQLFTDACGQIVVQANTMSTSNAVNGITDGWIFHR